MSNISQIIASLRTELNKLESKQGQVLAGFQEKLDPLSDLSNQFEESWVGGWGQKNFNVYRNPRNCNEGLQVNDQYFKDMILKEAKINLDTFEENILENLKPYRKFQQKLVTELSIIRDKENFSNENELLKTLEDFEWGFDISNYIKLRRPSQIPIYDMRVLSRGLDTPPHIMIAGIITTLLTKCIAAKNFEELSTRVLRQVELKLGGNSVPENVGYGEKILNDIFENFHSFYTQLKNRHDNRSTIEIKDEYDVQDLLHCILKLHFKDVREEEYTPSYAGSSSRMDFLLKNENIIIEVKKTREKLLDKQIGEQLILDVAHYKNHPNCKILKCFVYDPDNRVKNPRGLENDLSKLSQDDFSVQLFIKP